MPERYQLVGSTEEGLQVPVLVDSRGRVVTADAALEASLARVAKSGSYRDLADRPNLSPVATSGVYNELSGLPALKDVALSGRYDDLLGLPALKAVATSGNYGDLEGAPALASIALSGRWTDLLGTPAFSAVATSGRYVDLLGLPALKAVATSGRYGDLEGAPALAPVATSGKYSDLANRGFPVSWQPGRVVSVIDGYLSNFQLVTANVLYLHPFICPRTFTASEIGGRLSTNAAGGSCRFGIYGSDSSSMPTGLPVLSSGLLSTAVAATLSGPCAGQLVEGALYWTATIASAAVGFSHFNGNSLAYALVAGAQSFANALSGPSGSGGGRSLALSSVQLPDLTGQSTVEYSGTSKAAVLAFKIASLP